MYQSWCVQTYYGLQDMHAASPAMHAMLLTHQAALLEVEWGALPAHRSCASLRQYHRQAQGCQVPHADPVSATCHVRACGCWARSSHARLLRWCR